MIQVSVVIIDENGTPHGHAIELDDKSTDAHIQKAAVTAFNRVKAHVAAQPELAALRDEADAKMAKVRDMTREAEELRTLKRDKAADEMTKAAGVLYDEAKALTERRNKILATLA